MMIMKIASVANEEPAKSQVVKAIGQSTKPNRNLKCSNWLVSQLKPIGTNMERSNPTRAAAATEEIPLSLAYGTAKQGNE